MDDPVQKPSSQPVDPFSLPQRPSTPPPIPRPSAPSASAGAPDLRFVEPTRPTVPSPAAPSTPVPPPMPARPMPTPASPSPAPAPSVAQNQQYTSSIRTMSEDISRLKSGQQPVGVNVQKSVEAPKPQAPTPKPPVPMPSAPSQGPSTATSLGQAEKTRPLAPSSSGMTPPPMPASSAPAPQILVPEAPAGSHNRLYLLMALGAVLIGGLYWFLTSQSDEDIAQITPTPSASATPTSTPTPAPKTAATLIGGPRETIMIPASGDPSAGFAAKVTALSLSGGELRRIAVTTETKGEAELTPVELMDRFVISYPAELKTQVGPETAMAVYGQKESFDTKGIPVANAPIKNRLVLISEVTNSVGATQTLKTWEATLATSLTSLLKYDRTKAATPGFLDSIYQGKAIRYKNFAWPDSTIDYSVMTASNGKTYLVIANSREAIFATIDKLK